MGKKNKAPGKHTSSLSSSSSSSPSPSQKRLNATGHQTNTIAQTAVTTAWPPFRPALPVTELTFDAPIHAFRDQIVLLRNFWPRSLCRDYLAFLADLPLTTTPGRPKRGEATRVNDRFQIQDAQFAQRLWLQTGLRDVVLDEAVKHLWGGEVVGLNPNVRVYRYSQNQFFDCHFDIQSDDGLGSISAKTTWTALLYLTSAADGVVGGETVFYPHDRKSAREELVIAPETGMLLLHKHGDNCLLHEGREVVAGQKWIVRTDLCVLR
ncbi:hypothetical protein GGS24DRAFT_515398 [Hypoxylon argillaceum]|nr:hypothetical protein GGS24DRAFT_515398 [Hypoxylon argillaceum]